MHSWNQTSKQHQKDQETVKWRNQEAFLSVCKVSVGRSKRIEILEEV